MAGFDQKKWHKPAIQGDVGGLAIKVASALLSVKYGLICLKDGNEEAFNKALDDIERLADECQAQFKDLTGYFDE